MLADALKDWTDWDVAALQGGKALSVFPKTSTMADYKHVFWTDNPLGNQLHQVLLALASARVLERKDDPDEQFRWGLTRSSGAPRGAPGQH
jgi:hypothetical protein